MGLSGFRESKLGTCVIPELFTNSNLKFLREMNDLSFVRPEPEITVMLRMSELPLGV